jgi:hypothetical protein
MNADARIALCARLVAATIALAGCAPAPPDGVDPVNERVGCIPFEPVPGYVTCLGEREPREDGPGSLDGLVIEPLDETLPDAVDLRTDAAVGACLHVESQGRTGWCFAYAVTSSLEALYCAGCPGDPALIDQVSVLHARWRYFGERIGRSIPSTFTEWHLDEGGFEDQLAAMLVREGTTSEALLPTSHDLFTINDSVRDRTPASFASIYRPVASQRLYPGPGLVDAFRRALADGRVPIAALPVLRHVGWSSGDATYGAIASWEGAPARRADIPQCLLGPDEVETPCRAGRTFGWHAVALVAYDDATETFTLMNSWGTDWASGGFATVDYEYVARWSDGGATMTGVDASAGAFCEAPSCDGLSCEECTAQEGCEQCPDTGRCIGAAEAASCAGGTLTLPAQCGVCHETGQTCGVRAECCNAGRSLDVHCIDGFCEDISTCTLNGESCTAGGRCCGLNICSLDTAGRTECCSRPGDRCSTHENCCGFELCVDGHCAARAIGQSCLDTQECEGASYCLDEHVCGF